MQDPRALGPKVPTDCCEGSPPPTTRPHDTVSVGGDCSLQKRGKCAFLHCSSGEISKGGGSKRVRKDKGERDDNDDVVVPPLLAPDGRTTFPLEL